MVLTDSQFDMLKSIIFGNQKQANVQNEAVVKLIADEVAAKGYMNDLATEESARAALKAYVNDVVENPTTMNEIPFMLLCGERSVAVVKQGGPIVAISEQPNVESPKTFFRVTPLESFTPVERTVQPGTGGPRLIAPEEAGVAGSVGGNSTPENYRDRVEELKNKILPLVPDGVKKELSDPYQQCLCCAEYFYNL